MMAMDKNDFFNRGKSDAAQGGKGCTPPKNGTWQRVAYDAGFAAYGRAADSGRVSSFAQRDVQTEGWPRAAAEHAHRLVADMNRERNPARHNRLSRALARMQKRHGAARSAFLSTPITTQPHPDGPITIGQIFQGL
jgi:hypothetical protein